MTEGMEAPVPARFRSNSVPMPKIEVTCHEDQAKNSASAANADQTEQEKNGGKNSEDGLQGKSNLKAIAIWIYFQIYVE